MLSHATTAPFATTTAAEDIRSICATDDGVAATLMDDRLVVAQLAKDGTFEATGIRARATAVHDNLLFVAYGAEVASHAWNAAAPSTTPLATVSLLDPVSTGEDEDDDPDAFVDEDLTLTVDTLAVVNGNTLAVGTCFTEGDDDELVDSPVGVLTFSPDGSFKGLHAFAHNELGASPCSADDRPGTGPLLHVAAVPANVYGKHAYAILANSRSTDNHCALLHVGDDGITHVTPADDRFVLNVPMAEGEADNTIVGLAVDLSGGAGLGHGPLAGPADPRGSDLPTLHAPPLFALLTSDGHVIFYQVCMAGATPVHLIPGFENLEATIAALPPVPAAIASKDAQIKAAMAAGLPDGDDDLLSDDDEDVSTPSPPPRGRGRLSSDAVPLGKPLAPLDRAAKST